MGFIAGPRQVGKTTVAKSLLTDPDGYFSWDIEDHQRRILRDPGGFWSQTPPLRRIVLDEIHKYPRWKRFLKGLYDSVGKQLEILVTGSGRLDVYQKGGDSLLGRYWLTRLHPFSIGELMTTDRASVRPPETAIKDIVSNDCPRQAREILTSLEEFTGFPEPLFAASRETLVLWRRSHRQLILREDLRDLTRVRELGLIDALVQLLPGRIGSPLSLNALREDLNVAFVTVQLWIEILSRLYYLFEIRPYAGRLARTLRREAKIYLFEGTQIEEAGARFENLVALHLKKACDAWSDWGFGDFELHYVRDKEKREVDFLITEDGKPYLLAEAKLSGSEISKDLVYFRERLKPPHAFQVVKDLPQRMIFRKDMNAYVIAADRFLSRLP